MISRYASIFAIFAMYAVPGPLLSVWMGSRLFPKCGEVIAIALMVVCIAAYSLIFYSAAAKKEGTAVSSNDVFSVTDIETAREPDSFVHSNSNKLIFNRQKTSAKINEIEMQVLGEGTELLNDPNKTTRSILKHQHSAKNKTSTIMHAAVSTVYSLCLTVILGYFGKEFFATALGLFFSPNLNICVINVVAYSFAIASIIVFYISDIYFKYAFHTIIGTAFALLSVSLVFFRENIIDRDIIVTLTSVSKRVVIFGPGAQGLLMIFLLVPFSPAIAASKIFKGLGAGIKTAAVCAGLCFSLAVNYLLSSLSYGFFENITAIEKMQADDYDRKLWAEELRWEVVQYVCASLLLDLVSMAVNFMALKDITSKMSEYIFEVPADYKHSKRNTHAHNLKIAKFIVPGILLLFTALGILDFSLGTVAQVLPNLIIAAAFINLALFCLYKTNIKNNFIDWKLLVKIAKFVMIAVPVFYFVDYKLYEGSTRRPRSVNYLHNDAIGDDNHTYEFDYVVDW
ncbi:hypothetical protein ENBRE01_0911 [Enteropsectra breve]|nr:hypothetical protein ENBRE01_0911 [Enteropsectra breve]